MKLIKTPIECMIFLLYYIIFIFAVIYNLDFFVAIVIDLYLIILFMKCVYV